VQGQTLGHAARGPDNLLFAPIRDLVDRANSSDAVCRKAPFVAVGFP
jgi:hypothetical protein